MSPSTSTAARDVTMAINFSEYQEKRHERESLRDQIRNVLHSGSNSMSVGADGEEAMGGFRPLGEPVLAKFTIDPNGSPPVHQHAYPN